MPTGATFDPTALSDDDLRAAVAIAQQRLPHEETCEHCAAQVRSHQQGAVAGRREVAEFNDRAAAAGFLIATNRTLVHRWDCPSMQAQVRLIEEFRSGEDYEKNLQGGFDMMLPTPATAEEARDFANSSKARRGCRTCAPDL